jgi:hypothetical protein
MRRIVTCLRRRRDKLNFGLRPLRTNRQTGNAAELLRFRLARELELT